MSGYLSTNTDVVIKEFRFLTEKDWSVHKQIESEVSALKNLQHPGIPRYLKSFDSERGVCLVQE